VHPLEEARLLRSSQSGRAQVQGRIVDAFYAEDQGVLGYFFSEPFGDIEQLNGIWRDACLQLSGEVPITIVLASLVMIVICTPCWQIASKAIPAHGPYGRTSE
jgi:hypothetical protein